jgi:hypothetical protein
MKTTLMDAHWWIVDEWKNQSGEVRYFAGPQEDLWLISER